MSIMSFDIRFKADNEPKVFDGEAGQYMEGRITIGESGAGWLIEPSRPEGVKVAGPADQLSLRDLTARRCRSLLRRERPERSADRQTEQGHRLAEPN